MLIIQKDILFKRATVNNVQYGGDGKPICSYHSGSFGQLMGYGTQMNACSMYSTSLQPYKNF